MTLFTFDLWPLRMTRIKHQFLETFRRIWDTNNYLDADFLQMSYLSKKSALDVTILRLLLRNSSLPRVYFACLQKHTDSLRGMWNPRCFLQQMIAASVIRIFFSFYSFIRNIFHRIIKMYHFRVFGHFHTPFLWFRLAKFRIYPDCGTTFLLIYE